VETIAREDLVPQGCCVDLHVHHELPVFGPFLARSLHRLPPAHAETEGCGVLGYALYTWSFPTRRAGAAEILSMVRRLRARAARPLITDGASLRSHLAGGRGTAGFLCLEGLRFLDDPSSLEALVRAGVVAVQPVHFWDNAYAHSYRFGLVPVSEVGLTGLGRELLCEIERLGLLLDLAHMNRATMDEVLARFRGPVLCSHTGLTSLRETTRNLPDAIASEIFRRGGLVGVTPWRRLLPRFRGTGLAAWNDAFVRTVEALVALGGEHGVALGSDRGAPLLVPPSFLAPPNVAQLQRVLESSTGIIGLGEALFGGNAVRFLLQQVPVRSQCQEYYHGGPRCRKLPTITTSRDRC